MSDSTCPVCKSPIKSPFHVFLCPILAAGETVNVLIIELDELWRLLPDIVGSTVDRSQGSHKRNPSGTVSLSRRKAKLMLEEGKAITPRQRRFFGWVAGGRKEPNKIGQALQTLESPAGIVFDETKLALQNTHYRHVLSTTPNQQIVLMAITKEDGGVEEEIHPYSTQTLRVVSGKGTVVINGVSKPLKSWSSVVIAPGTKHEVIQSGGSPLRLSSTYAPPVHDENLVEVRRVRESKKY
jgi:mannose-6-phosphate isomerase-like protein (cupin superfamily)